jgi:hypothetical protein
MQRAIRATPATAGGGRSPGTKIPIALRFAVATMAWAEMASAVRSKISARRSNQIQLLVTTPALAGVDLVVALNRDGPMHACDDQDGYD